MSDEAWTAGEKRRKMRRILAEHEDIIVNDENINRVQFGSDSEESDSGPNHPNTHCHVVNDVCSRCGSSDMHSQLLCLRCASAETPEPERVGTGEVGRDDESFLNSIQREDHLSAEPFLDTLQRGDARDPSGEVV